VLARLDEGAGGLLPHQRQRRTALDHDVRRTDVEPAAVTGTLDADLPLENRVRRPAERAGLRQRDRRHERCRHEKLRAHVKNLESIWPAEETRLLRVGSRFGRAFTTASP